MPYGVKRGYKAPGEFGFGDIFGLSLAGAAGIISALITDYQQSGEASALFTINQWVVDLGGMLGYTAIPLWMVTLTLTVVGALSIFYFQPITRQGAFAQGFGLLAVIMTMVPADLAGGIESVPGDDDLPGLAQVFQQEAIRQNGVRNASYTAGEARVIPVQSRRSQAAKYDLHLTINFIGGIPDEVDSLIRRGQLRGRLHNEDTDETWNLFKSAGGDIRQDGDTIYIHAGVPARSEEARLWVRIECPTHEIVVESNVAKLGQPLNWTVDLEPSDMPLFLQRLGKSYWF